MDLSRPRLVVNQDAWYDHYWRTIRSLWGAEGEPTRTSICAYVQTMIWLSVLTFLSIPFVIIGWLALKALRIFYSLNEKCSLGQKFNDFADRLGFDDYLDSVPNQMQKHFVLTTSGMGLRTCLFGISGVGVFVILSLGIGEFFSLLIDIIPSIPGWILLGIGYLGWGIFHAFAFLGWLLNGLLFTVIPAIGHFLAMCGVGIWNFITNPDVWITIGMILAYACLALIIMVASVYIIYRVANTKSVSKSFDFIIMKINGFVVAKEKATKRREKERPEPEKEPEEKHEFKEPKDYIAKVLICLLAPVAGVIAAIEWLGKTMADSFRGLFAKDLYLKTGVVRVVGFFTLIGEVGWAIKNKACPIIERITDGEIKEMMTFYVFRDRSLSRRSQWRALSLEELDKLKAETRDLYNAEDDMEVYIKLADLLRAMGEAKKIEAVSAYDAIWESKRIR